MQLLEGFDSCFFYSSSVSLFSYHFTFIFSSLLFCLLARKRKEGKIEWNQKRALTFLVHCFVMAFLLCFPFEIKAIIFNQSLEVERETYSNSSFVTTCTEYSNEYFMNKNVKWRRFKQIFGSNWKKWNVILTNGQKKWNWTGICSWLSSSLCQKRKNVILSHKMSNVN